MKTRNPLSKLMFKPKRGKNKVIDESESASTDCCSSIGPRHVCINESQTVFYDNTNVLDDADISDLWYNSKECKQMKGDMSAAAKAVCHYTSQSDTYVASLERVFKSCSQGKVSSKQEEETLSAQMQQWGAYRTGLEFKIIAYASQHKDSRRKELIQLCYNLQQENPSLSKEELGKVMRKKCGDITRPARLFAVQIARAQQR
mmetsp:Transcript_1786/g.2533  ORF Transcript_1786/g.2533 Transcript_1786/m.2533 type:complete len:202 (-) Transcript_1786:73-678(-)